MLRGIIFALLLVTTFTFVSCGGGGSSSDIILPASDGDTGEYISITEELSGTISVNSETGVAIYESEEIEIKQGLLFKRSTVLTAKDPHNDQLGYSGMSILKFTNTTGSEQTTKFIEEIPKSFATHVDQLEYKALINKSPTLSITDLLNDSSSFVSIDDFVNNGYIEVLEEDPVLNLLIGGTAVIGATYMLFYHPEIYGLTSLSSVADLNTDEETKKWVDDALLTKYCSAIRDSAETNNIPAKLLANIVLNEMVDNDWKDSLQEVIYTGENRSHGWPQLQPQRIIDHKLIDIGTVDEVRDPTVDIVESDLIAYERVDPGGLNLVVKTPVNNKIHERLVTPEPSIELAAREIAYLLDMFKKGSSVLSNPWAKALLINPEEGIDRNDIYANLKVLPTLTDDPDELQIAKDRTLALLVAAGYNGSGTIFNLTKETEVFTAIELSYLAESGYDGLVDHKIPWVQADDLDESYSFFDPRIHGINAGEIFPKVLHESACLEETVLWPNYPNAEYCSMKEDERTERYSIYIDIDSATLIHCLYYPTGQLEWELPYVDNEVDGIWKLYNDDGSLREYIFYADGEQI